LITEILHWLKVRSPETIAGPLDPSLLARSKGFAVGFSVLTGEG
jgi:hypothetical protein